MKTDINNRVQSNVMKKISILFIVFVAMLSSSFAVEGNTEALRWQFEEGSGNIILDSSGNSNYGILTGGSYTTTSKWGTYGLNFDGNNDYVRTITYQSIPDVLSVNLWAYRKSNNGWRSLFSITDDTYDHLVLNYDKDLFQYQVTYVDNLNITRTVTFAGNLTRNVYEMVTFEIDYDNNSLKVYEDKVLMYNNTLAYTLKESDSDNKLVLGTNIFIVNDFRGFFDEVRIFDFKLNDTNLNSLFATNTLTFPDSVIGGGGDGETNDTNVTLPVFDFQEFNVINSSSPAPLSNNINPTTFEFNLNQLSTCELYIDNHLEQVFVSTFAGSFDKEFLPNSVHQYFLHCFYNFEGIQYYELQSPIEFYVGNTLRTVNFYLYNNQSQLLNYPDLYLVTPCLEENMFIPFGSNQYTEGLNKHTDKYIQKVSVGQASFNLPFTYDYEYCLVRGQINNIYDEFNTNFDIVSVEKQLELGNIKVDNASVSFSLVLGDEDLYNFYDPGFWGKTWKSLFNLIITFLIGIPILIVGLKTENGKIVLAGVLVILAGLGVTMSNIILGAIF